jgi:hypothetical protein
MPNYVQWTNEEGLPFDIIQDKNIGIYVEPNTWVVY